MKLKATVEVKQNLSIVARERGKIVARRDGHNIWLDLGREYLAQLIAYQTISPLTPIRNDRIKYMGVGIGGTRQLATATVSAPPLSNAYPGANIQTDDDPSLTTLERPVRLSGTSTNPPYNAADVWIGEVQAPPTFPVATQVTFKRLITQLQVSYSPFLVVPLSEIGLFTAAAVTNQYNNTMVAYDTFESLAKTDAFELEISWTIRF